MTENTTSSAIRKPLQLYDLSLLFEVTVLLMGVKTPVELVKVDIFERKARTKKIHDFLYKPST